MAAKLLAKVINALTIGVYDDFGNVENLSIISESPPRRLGFDQPIITDIPVGGYTDIYFAKNFDYTWGILGTSLNSVLAKFQIYNGSGVPQYRGSVGIEFSLVAAPDNYATNSPFNRAMHGGWYMRISNLSTTSTLRAQALVLGAFYSSGYYI